MALRALVSFVLAWTLFSLCYGAGYGLLLLGSFAMHGAQPWHYLSQGGAIGALLGGGAGLLPVVWAGRRAGRIGHRTTWIVWIVWMGIGLLVSLGPDHEGLSRRHDAAPLLPPALMLGASVVGVLLLWRAARTERSSQE